MLFLSVIDQVKIPMASYWADNHLNLFFIYAAAKSQFFQFCLLSWFCWSQELICAQFQVIHGIPSCLSFVSELRQGRLPADLRGGGGLSPGGKGTVLSGCDRWSLPKVSAILKCLPCPKNHYLLGVLTTGDLGVSWHSRSSVRFSDVEFRI